MANFDSDTLNPEEEIGGFQAGEQGDETFKIHNLDSYPGELPAPISSDDKPIYNSKEDNTIIDSETESDEETIEDGDIDESEAEQEESWNLVDDSETDIFGSGDVEDEIDEEDDPYKDLFGDTPVGKKEVATKNAALNDAPIDDGLKEIINKELERSKSRKEQKQEDELQEQEESAGMTDIPLVQPTGPAGKESFVDFGDIDADKPSTYGLDKAPDTSNIPETPTEEKKGDKDKKRSPLFWPLIVGAAALLMLGSVIGTWFFLQEEEDEKNYRLYLSLRNFGFIFDIPETEDSIAWISNRMEDFLDEDGNIDNEKVNDFISGKSDDKGSDSLGDSADLTVNEPDNIDTTAVSPTGDPDSQDTYDPDNLNPDSEIDNYIRNQNDIVRNPNTTISRRNNTNTEERRSENRNPFRDNSNENTIETVVNDKRDVSPAEERVSNIQPATTDKVENTDKTDEPTESDIASSKTPDEMLEEIRKRQSPDNIDEDRSYTVQVFSTLSRDDAELWRKKLDNRKVGKAYISEHSIRDQTWYRVRVGDYPSREEAQKIARKLGYSQVWVDRVK